MNSDFDAYEKNGTDIDGGTESPENELDISASESDDAAEVKQAEPNGTGKTEIVGIRFRKNGKTYYFAPGDFKLLRDDRVIVDTARGQEYGYTAVPNRMINDSEIVAPLRQVVRMASKEDTAIHEENLRREIDAFNSCIMLIDENKLEMKLIDVELSFDRSKLMFYFSAEGRVDFRDLVKELAGKFKTRIEMRQIGIRDEAKILGGLGVCGRPFCCSSFLSDFVQVSVKMAKEQNLSLNSAKISGACGRLMCCLRYEYDTYLAEKALTPKVDTRVMTPDGAGVVTAANPLAGIVKVRLDKATNENEQVAFVREDVVKEDEYKGERLVKSAVPERKHKEEENDVFGFAGAIGVNRSETQPSRAPEEKRSAENGSPASGASDGKRQNGANNNKKEDGKNRSETRDGRDQRKDKDKRGDGSRAQGEASENKQGQNGGNGKKKNNRHNRQKHDRDRRDVKDDRQKQNDTSEKNEKNAPQREQQHTEKPASQNTEKKKHFRPYYKNHKKNNKNRTGDGQTK